MSADRIEGLAMDMEDLQRDIDDINNVIEGGYLSQALAEAKDEVIACKEDCGGGGFSSNHKYRE